MNARQFAEIHLRHKKPSVADAMRHRAALDIILDLATELRAVGHRDFAAVGVAIDRCIRALGGRVPDAERLDVLNLESEFPPVEVYDVVRALGRVRMCTNRVIGADTPFGGWREELDATLRSLELAVACAIVATPVVE